MDILQPKAVIGTNAWGGSLYGKAVRGSYVEDDIIKDAMKTAKDLDIPLYDLARDYGLGKAQKMIGEFGTKDIYLSAKYTPFTHYKKGCVRRSLEKDLNDFKRDYVDIYWLHLPTDIEEHLKEIIELYQEGKIKYIGVSNFTLQECILSRKILDDAGIPLYGVQNHYSILCREWETNGLLDWCQENGISFWGWAVLEEGLLVDPRIKKSSPMKLTSNRKVKKLNRLYHAMIKVADTHEIKVPQVAMAFCVTKGVVPMCGCRKPDQVQDLFEATKITLTEQEIHLLETAADAANVQIMGADLFRPFVLKGKDAKSKSKEYFNKHKNSRLAYAGYWSRDYRYALSVIGKIKPDNLLDVGCGTGAFLSIVEKKYPDITLHALDLSEEMIRETASRLSDSAICRVGDSENMPLEDLSYKVVTCNMSIHHYPHPQKAIQEMHRVLKHGGYLILNDMDCAAPIRAVSNLVFPRLKAGDVKMYNREEILKMMRNAGFQKVVYRKISPFSFQCIAKKL